MNIRWNFGVRAALAFMLVGGWLSGTLTLALQGSKDMMLALSGVTGPVALYAVKDYFDHAKDRDEKQPPPAA